MEDRKNKNIKYYGDLTVVNIKMKKKYYFIKTMY